MRPCATGVWGLTLLLQAKGVLGASISYSLPRAQRPEVDKEQVEILLMKTLSLKLMRGVIDQVDQTVRPSAVVRSRLVALRYSRATKRHGTEGEPRYFQAGLA